MKTVSTNNIHGLREDIDLYPMIQATLPPLTDILKDMNTLIATIRRDEDFRTIFDALLAKLEEQDDLTQPRSPTVESTNR